MGGTAKNNWVIAVGIRATPPHVSRRALIEAHPVLVLDDQRRNGHRERDGAGAVRKAIAPPKQAFVSSRRARRLYLHYRKALGLGE